MITVEQSCLYFELKDYPIIVTKIKDKKLFHEHAIKLCNYKSVNPDTSLGAISLQRGACF